MTLFHLVKHPDDRFILSKGHAAGALYAVLWSLGLLRDDELDSFCGNGTRLPAHPHGDIPGILFPTGSLGHGPGLACGLSLAARQSGSERHVYCLCGDGEWQEGSCWEALFFAVHHKLDNVTFIIDQNGLQGFGLVRDISSVASNFAPRFAVCGAMTEIAPGHDPEAIARALSRREAGKPSVVILETVKGRGLVNAGELSCHYLPLSDEEYAKLSGKTEGAHA